MKKFGMQIAESGIEPCGGRGLAIKKAFAAAAAFCAFFATACTAFAAEVSGEDAAGAVKGWIALKESFGGTFDAEPESVAAYSGLGGTGTYYVVSLKGGGFVVTSGDTAFEPVLAYSKTGAWNTNAAENPLMAMLEIDVAAAAAAADAAGQSGGSLRASAGAASSSSAAKWARLRAAGAPARSGRASSAASAPSYDLRVGNLVQSSWSQSGRGENWYTPGNGEANYGNGHVCGCVATMGGQIMRYWKWPDSTVNVTAAGDFYSDVVYSGGTRGWNLSKGYYKTYSASSQTAWSPAFGGTYNWNYIKLNPSSSDSSTYKAALGKLTRDVGLSCYMRYASNGSGAPGPVIGHRFVDTFGYANAKIVNGWNKDAMLASIDAGMPCAVNVSYSGGGHAIVGDGYGYDSSGALFVHFNMGWGDVGSDRWYTPPNIDHYTSVGGCVYNIYPPSKGVADLTVVSGRVLSNGSAVGGVTVTAVNRETGASYTATSSSGGTKSFNGETSSTVGKGVYALMLPAGFYTISATSGSSSAKVERQVYTCLSSAWAGANGEPVRGRVGNIHGLDLNLGTAVSAPAVALTHRWSFNGDLGDSKGGSAAATIGSNVAVADGRAKMTGNGNSQGSLNLGTNLLDTDAATIEIWASQTEVRNWGRIFDYGADTTHYFTLTWTLGSDIMQDRAESKNTGTSDTDNTMAPYSLGVQYHISATFERQSDGGTAIRFMKRDATTGRLLRTGSLAMPAGAGLHNISNPVLYLGHSFYGADADACAEYDEVRIWKGVLSDAQLSANAKAGPDVLLTSVPASTEYTYVETAVWRGSGTPSAADLANASNWVCTDNNGNTVSGVPGEKTTVIVAGTTAFSIPGGYKPAWRKVQIGAGATATMWATNATLSSSSVPYMLLDANDYATQLGVGTVDTMQRGLIHNPENNPAELAGHQLRFDGWLKVESAQAGHWKLHGYVDDYIALKIDDEWVLYCRTTGECHGAIDMKAGWHRFTMIAGDSGIGGYGAYIVAGNHKKLTPVGVKINGGSELAFSSENFTFGSGSETVRLSADCDWSALGEISLDGAALDLCGHTLRVDSLTGSYLGAKVTNSSSSPAKIVLTEGGSVDLSNITVDNNVKVLKQYATAEQLIENDATFWLDASVADTLTVNGNGEVTRWASRVGSNAAVQNGSMALPAYDTTQGYPTVDFGAVQSGKDLAFTRMTDVYTVFMAVKIAKSPDAFWLGDANEYHFHRGNNSGYWVEYSNGAYIERMWNGKDEVAKEDIPSDTEPIVVCMEMSRACAASSMTQDRAIPERNGGKQLSELIVFDYVLTDEQREMVTQYLLDKWPTEHAATPAASPAAATFAADSLSVSLSCETAGATIYYTTDGSEPTKDSTKYAGPIAINATTTIKAKAYADHYLESEVYTGTFTQAERAATPYAAPGAGTFTEESISVRLLCATAGATIYYTTDGSEPTTGSTRYTGAITIAATTTIKAVAAADGLRNSEVYTGVFTQAPRAATPSASPAATTFFTDTLSVSLSCATAGATIYYTIDDSAPTTGSTRYTGPITIDATTTIKAIAAAGGLRDSEVYSATFTQAPRAATPTGSSVSTYRSALVDLASGVEGATIRYTTDGSDPTVESAIYEGSLPFSSSGTIKAAVFADGYRPSEVFTYEYYVKRLFGDTTGTNPAKYEDTEENRALHWIEETEDTFEATGLWTEGTAYSEGKILVEGGAGFTADSPSTNRIVKIAVTLSFGGSNDAVEYPQGVKAAARMGPDGGFQVYTRENGLAAWQTVEATGIDPDENADYEVLFELDCVKKTYTASIREADGSGDPVPLAAGSKTKFEFASAESTDSVREVRFLGYGTVTSLFGSYEEPASAGFIDGEEVEGSDGKITLNAAQAEWLNKFNAYDALKGRIASLSKDGFDEAYLLNLDIREDDCSKVFKVSAINVKENSVEITVTLVRAGAVQEGGKDAPINGVLKFHGADTLGGFTHISSKALADFDDKIESGEVKVEFPKNIDGVDCKFFKATIEEE